MDNIHAFFNQLVAETEINVTVSLFRLFVSFLLGAVIGVERQMRRREAGLRTFTLICLGATLAMLASIWIPQSYPNFLNGDPGRIAAQVLTGIGFLGAGAIIQSRGSIFGLTTAASIWVVAVIGLAVGAGMYAEAVIVTLLTVSILVTLERLEKHMMLAGVNKILTINCSTASPDIIGLHSTIEKHQVYIVSSSYEYDYDNDTSILTYKVNIRAKSSYSELIAAIRDMGGVSQIKILA